MTKAHVVRRSEARYLQLLVTALAIAACCAGCGRDGDAGGETRGASGVSERDYVSHVAALTVAVEEGLSGDAARERAVELGSPGLSRGQVEAFVDELRTEPERWVGVERRVDEMVEELRERGSGD